MYRLFSILALVALGGACGRTTQQCEACGPDAGSPAAAGTAGTGGVGGGGASNVNTGGLALVECELGGLEAPLIRYSAIDLERSLDAIFGPGPSLQRDFSDRSDAANQRRATPDFVLALRDAALARIAATPVDEAALSMCEADVDDRTTCVDSWIAERGLQLYRRPLSAEQVAGYVAQFHEQSLAATPAAAARSVLLSMVLSPYFVFRIELGTERTSTFEAPPRGAPEPLLPPGSPLGEYEVAARLSHFLARRAPDASLLAAVAKGDFRHRDSYLAHVERLLAAPESQDAHTLLHLEWLGLDGSRSPGAQLEPTLDRLMLEQSSLFIAGVLSRGGSFTDLLTSPRQPLNRPLAEHYGVPAPAGDGFELVELEPALYSGVLGQGAWLARRPSPTARGIGVLEQLLCSPPPPPPDDIDLIGFVGNTPRERISNATSHQPCIKCHELFDPIGFALEAFDEQGRPTGYDTTGSLLQAETGEILQLAGPLELGQALAKSADARACVARRYLEHAVQHQFSQGGEQWLECLTSAFAGSDLDLHHLTKAVAFSDAIKSKLSEPIGAVGVSHAADPAQHASEETQGLAEGFQTTQDRYLLEQYLDALRGLEPLP